MLQWPGASRRFSGVRCQGSTQGASKEEVLTGWGQEEEGWAPQRATRLCEGGWQGAGRRGDSTLTYLRLTLKTNGLAWVSWDTGNQSSSLLRSPPITFWQILEQPSCASLFIEVYYKKRKKHTYSKCIPFAPRGHVGGAGFAWPFPVHERAREYQVRAWIS